MRPGRPLAAVLAAGSLLLTGVALAPSASAATVDLNLLNINDFHGRIDANTVKFAGTVEQLRAAGGEANTLFLSAGDNIGASLFASSSQQDQPTIDVLNTLGLAASAVGNHEFDQGFADLTDRVIDDKTNAKWDYLGANVYEAGTTTPALPEYSIQTVGGLKVGIIGAVTVETPTLVSPAGIAGLSFGDPVAAVNRVAAQLKDGNAANGEADVLIAEYHEGASSGTPDGATLEQEVAEGAAFSQIVQNTAPSVAAIFTGHTHKQYAWDAPVPGQAGKTRPILQTGNYGEFIGQIKLTVNTDTDAVTAYTAANVARTTTPDADLVAAYPRVAQVKTITDAALAQAAVIGNQPVGKVTADITTAFSGGVRDDRGSESTLGNKVADALRDTLAPAERGGAQIGVVNPGGLRAELTYAGSTVGEGDGVVTYAEANAVLPFVNNLWSLSLTGAQFKTVLEQQWQPTTSSRPFLNLGLSDNVTYTYDPALAVGSRITSITVNGAKIDPAATYRIATFSFLGTGGDNFTGFTSATDVRDSGLVDRDAWISYLGANSPLSPSFARRGVIVTGLPSTVKAGDAVSFGVSKLDLTSLGSPANTTLTGTIGTTSVGSFPVTAGAATVSFTVPKTLSGAQTLVLTAAPSGTKISIPLSITAAPPAAGTITLTPTKTLAGTFVIATLDKWPAKTKLSLKIDGKGTATTVTTTAAGKATAIVLVPVKTTKGAHTLVVTAPSGATASAPFTVVKLF